MSEMCPSLEELEMRGDFVRRHIGPGDKQIAEMLGRLGCKSLDDLVNKAVPDNIVSNTPLDVPPAKSEREILEQCGLHHEAITSSAARILGLVNA